MNVQMSMTLGDVVVAASVVTAIITCYFSIKQMLTQFHADLIKVIRRVDAHDDVLMDHSAGIVALETKVFGRRRSDLPKPHKAD